MTEVLPGLPMFTRRLDLPDGNESLPTTLKMASATLPFDVRIRSRARIALDGGGEAGFILPRGHLLRGGDVLADETGQYLLRIQAAAETVSTLYCDDPLQLARACYHLGNRHVPLQIGPGFARYQHDHVLDDMLVQMGLHVVVEQAPFEPEAGAYQSAPHGHSHGHVHDHGHGHAQGYGHAQDHAHHHDHGHHHGHDHDHDHDHDHGHGHDHSHSHSHSHGHGHGHGHG